MRPVDADADADEERGPEPAWERLLSTRVDAVRRDVAALEREHVRAHRRARLRLLEIQGLLDQIASEVEAARGPGAGAERRVLELCEDVGRKAAEAARMGKRIVELHRQIASYECC